MSKYDYILITITIIILANIYNIVTRECLLLIVNTEVSGTSSFNNLTKRMCIKIHLNQIIMNIKFLQNLMKMEKCLFGGQFWVHSSKVVHPAA